MKVSFHGHAVVKVEAEGKTILFDPFITGNSSADLNAEDIKVDVILLTHGHNDHVGDTVDLALKNDALVIAPFELAEYLEWQGLRTHGMSIGGSHAFDFGTVKLTQAFHSSSYTDYETKTIVYTGMPSGILLTIGDKTIYHAGDTGLFSDMKMIGEQNDIDLAFLPIGDNYTMGPEDALMAAKWLDAKLVVPIHYNTFPVIEQNPDEFVARLPKKVGYVMNAGDTIDL